MNYGLVKSSNDFANAPILLLEWNIIYNSRGYIQFEFTFNTNLTKLDDDYTGTGDGLKAYLLYNTIEYPLTRGSIVSANKSFTTFGYPINNKAVFTYDSTQLGFPFLPGDISYDIVFRYPKSDDFTTIPDPSIDPTSASQTSFTLSDTSRNVSTFSQANVQGFEGVTITPFAALDLYNKPTYTIETETVEYYASDYLTFYPQNRISRIGSTSGVASNINNISSFFLSTHDYGRLYDTYADFTFDYSEPVGLTYSYEFSYVGLYGRIVKSDSTINDLIITDPQFESVFGRTDTDLSTISVSRNNQKNYTIKMHQAVLGLHGGLANLTFTGFPTGTTIFSSQNKTPDVNGVYTFPFIIDPCTSAGIDISGNMNMVTEGLILSMPVTFQIEGAALDIDPQTGPYPDSSNLRLYITFSAITPASVNFYDNNSLIATVTSDPFEYNYTLGGTTHDFYATIVTTDSDNLTTNHQLLIVGTPPVLGTLSVVQSPTYHSGNTLTFTINASSSDSTVSVVVFYHVDNSDNDINGLTADSHTSSASTYSANWTAVTGTFRVRARAFDNHGLQTVSNIITITVI